MQLCLSRLWTAREEGQAQAAPSSRSNHGQTQARKEAAAPGSLAYNHSARLPWSRHTPPAESAACPAKQ